MKIMFVDSKRKTSEIDIDFSQLPTKVYLAYSIQYKDLARHIKKKLGGVVAGSHQVLGCSKLKTHLPILLIGSGRFHAIQLAISSTQDIYTLEGSKVVKVGSEEVEKAKQKKKGAYLRYLNADSVGVLISTKLGQYNLKQAVSIKSKIKGKKSYLFISNMISGHNLDDFSSIESWINTACPAIHLDSSKIVNAEDVKWQST
ncbi:MAG: diphthamide synthesis protein [archaeon]